MIVKFKKGLLIGGHHYSAGVQEISEEKLKHPHFTRFIKAGLVTMPGDEEIPASMESEKERGLRILKKERAAAKAKSDLLKAAEPPPPPPPAPDPAPFDPVYDVGEIKADDAQPAIKGSKKSKKG